MSILWQYTEGRYVLTNSSKQATALCSFRWGSPPKPWPLSSLLKSCPCEKKGDSKNSNLKIVIRVERQLFITLYYSLKACKQVGLKYCPELGQAVNPNYVCNLELFWRMPSLKNHLSFSKTCRTVPYHAYECREVFYWTGRTKKCYVILLVCKEMCKLTEL